MEVKLDQINIQKTPRFSHLLSSLRDPLQFFGRLEKMGPITQYRGVIKFFYISDPQLVKKFLELKEEDINKNNPLYNRLRDITGKGLITGEGQEWKDIRAQLVPFFKSTFLPNYDKIILDSIENLNQRWDQKIKQSQKIFLSKELRLLTLEIIGKIVLGSDFKREKERLIYWSSIFSKYIAVPPVPIISGSWFPRPINREMKRAKRCFKSLIRELIKNRKEAKAEVKDVLGALTSFYSHLPPEKSLDKIVEQVLTIIIAGHETSSHGLFWTLLHLNNHPGPKRELQTWIEKSKKIERGTFLCQVLENKNTILDFVIKEGLRLSPPVWIITRNTLKDIKLNDFKINKGSMVVTCPYYVHRNPSLWENPDQFDPFRFKKSDASDWGKGLIPFGVGPRSCIGGRLAMREMKLILSCLLERYDFIYEGDFPNPLPSFTFGPEEDIQIMPFLRNSGRNKL